MSVKERDKIANTTGCCSFKWRNRKNPDRCPNPDCPTNQKETP